MLKLLRNIVYSHYINFVIRNSLKIFKGILPEKLKIPVSGIIKIKAEDDYFYLKTNQTDYVCKVLFWKGINNYEPAVAKVLIPLFKKIDVFFDVGASIGYYSVLSATLNKNLKVYAFEPGKGAYEYLEYNIKKNNLKNVHTYKLAASNFVGETTFYIESSRKANSIEQLSGGSSLKKGEESSFNYEEEKVVVTTLDKFLVDNNLNLKVDLMKLDTERTENLVLEGSANILHNHKPIIICEVIKNNIEKELELILKQYNYIIYKTTPNGLIKVSTLISDEELVYYLFIHPEKEVLIKEFIIK